VTEAAADISWPAFRLGEAIMALGQHSGLGIRSAALESPPAKLLAEGGERLGRWIEAAAAWLGLEAEPVQAPYAGVEDLLRGAGPALLRIARDSEARFLLVLARDRMGVSLLTPELVRIRLAPDAIRALLCREYEGRFASLIDEILIEADIRRRRRNRARQALQRELLVTAWVGGCWLIRPAPDMGFTAQVREARISRLFFILLCVNTCEYSLWILSWWLLGWMTLNGRLEPGWLLAWLLLLLTLIPCRLLGTSVSGRLAIQAGAVLKRRLLFGALRLEPDEIRHQGIGQLLGRVLESGAIESVALSGGLLGVTAIIELILAAFVLGAGAGSWRHLILLVGTAIAAFCLGLRYYRRQRHWTGERLELTNDLVERMVGHRTRLAQEARAHWNEGEDQALERYLGVSRELDRAGVAFQVLVPRGWLIAGLLGLAPAFIVGDQSSLLVPGIAGLDPCFAPEREDRAAAAARLVILLGSRSRTS
jgi:ATP-binding cassette subfamily B protein